MNNYIHTHIPSAQQAVVAHMVEDLISVPGVEAIVLGGSRARKTAHAASDVDLGVYYYDTQPLNIEMLYAVAQKYSKRDAPLVVTQPYEWGPWVNGGAWIHTEIGKVDILYRSIDRVARVIQQALCGELELHYEQQPPFGFYSVMYLAEVKECLPFFDPHHMLLAFKQQITEYPAPLKIAIVQQNLWAAEFALHQASKAAELEDILSVAGCITRIFANLAQVLFALNSVYFGSDKHILDAIERFDTKPAEYKKRVTDILSSLGSSRTKLCNMIVATKQLWLEVCVLAEDMYAAKYTL